MTTNWPLGRLTDMSWRLWVRAPRISIHPSSPALLKGDPQLKRGVNSSSSPAFTPTLEGGWIHLSQVEGFGRWCFKANGVIVFGMEEFEGVSMQHKSAMGVGFSTV